MLVSFFFSSRRRHTRWPRDWSSDVCSSDLDVQPTFCEGGALGVDGGNAVAERIATYAARHRNDYALVVTTQDWHIDQIGRASCRERVEIAVGGGAVTNRKHASRGMRAME